MIRAIVAIGPGRARDEKYDGSSEGSDLAPRLAFSGVLLEEDAARMLIDLPDEAAPDLLALADPRLATRLAEAALARQAASARP